MRHGVTCRRTLICIAICVLLIEFGFLANAQQPRTVFKIGMLGGGSGLGLFRRELRELGYVEGKNIIFEYRQSDGKLDRLPALVDELIRLKVDVLVASSTPAAIAARNATTTIPIVFLTVPDPVGAGLVNSLARPGRNITGVTNITAVLAGKRLELLKETIPKLSRVAVLWDPQNPGSSESWKESQVPARELGLQLQSMEISSADKLEAAFNETIKARSTAIVMAGGAFATSNQKRIADLAIEHNLPAIATRADFVESGVLMSYGSDLDEPYRRVASMVAKILKGTKPPDIPVEQPTKFKMLINVRTAKQIGLTIPPNVLARADKVIR